MTPRRVIEDSDEDDDSFGTPEILNPFMTMEKVGAIPMMQPLSTDPVLFRAVYEEHFGQLLVDDELPNHGLSPVFEDPIIDQRMSSSASMPSARKLIRSNTINVSSLSSVSEPTLSNRKAKRTKSMKDVDDLTQITTPRKSKEATPKDPWEVPASSASDKPSDAKVKVKSRNAERKISMKTYGRPIRRTQTVAHTTRNQSNDGRLSSPLQDNISESINQNRFLPSHDDDDDLPMRKIKRHKVGLSVSGNLPEVVPKEPQITNQKDVPSELTDFTSTSVEPILIHVQPSTTERSHVQSGNCVAVYNHAFSSPPVENRTILDASVVDSRPVTISSAAQTSRTSLTSIVIVPDNLTDEQKLHYDIVSVPSTAQSRRASILEIMESNTMPNDTLLPKPCSGTIEESAHATSLSPNPPTSAMNRKMKRTKSEVGYKRPASSAATGAHDNVKKRKGRSKTITLGEEPPHREVSVDELSLASLESARKTVSREASIRNNKKRALVEDEDELYIFQETGLEKAQYQPRPSLRRSRSISMSTSKDGVDLEAPRVRAVRRKSSKAADTPSHSASGDVELSMETLAKASIIQNYSAMATSVSTKALTEGRARQTENPILKSMDNSQNTAEKPADVSVVETVPTGPAQPKRRGRKKTSEIVSDKSKSVSKTQSASKESEVQRTVLCETDSNQQPSQDAASLSPTKANTEAVTGMPPPVQTPTKDSTKGPDQHSPLQSGRVPYRVGLSRNTRIAPLLKMVRK